MSLQSQVLVMVELVFPPLCLSAVTQVNNQLLNVNSAPQEAAGAMLSKNETGVTALFNFTEPLKLHLFFDGFTAQLQFTGTDTGVLPPEIK